MSEDSLSGFSNVIVLDQLRLDALSSAIKTDLKAGSLVVFQARKENLPLLSSAIEKIHPILKNHGITALLIDEDVNLCVVPEARRVIPIPTKSREE